MKRRRGVGLYLGLWAALGSSAGLVACGGREAPSRIEIDLTRVPSCRIRGRLAPCPVQGGSFAPLRLVQTDARPIDLFLRLPAESELRFELPAAAARGLRIGVASDTRRRAFEPTASGDGWRVDLSDFDGEIVRLRFENRSAGPVAWLRPRLLGSAPTPAVALPLPPSEGARPLNIVLYVVDTLRPDRLSIYGYERPTSPRLAALARGAVLFQNAYAAAPGTMGSIPALFTSIGDTDALQQLRPDAPIPAPTLAEELERGGYATAAFQANATMRRSLGFDRGFGLYELPGPSDATPDAELLHTPAFAWLEALTGEPFFLYVQSMDVHNPYQPPAPFLGRFGGDPDDALDPRRYDEAVAYADHEIGVLLARLDELGLSDSTAVVVTADHGESLGEGGRFLHANSLYEEQVRVPLLVALPWLRAPVRESAIVSLLDLAPTLLELAGLPVPDAFEGASLLRPHDRLRPRIALGHHPLEGWFVREGPWKLVADGKRVRLHDLHADPAESIDLAEGRPVTVAYLRGLIWERAASFRTGSPSRPDPLEGLPDAERRELERALRALGYID